MKHLFSLLLIAFLSVGTAFSQTNSEEEAVKATINMLFDGMRNSDTTLLKKAFGTQNTLQTIVRTKEGQFVVRTESLGAFIKSVGTPHTDKYDERITFTKILIDANLASVWTDYKFYVGDKFSHCGVNSFQLFKGQDGWKIFTLLTREEKITAISIKT